MHDEGTILYIISLKHAETDTVLLSLYIIYTFIFSICETHDVVEYVT